MPIEKKNVDRTYRNNKKPLKTVTRYTTIAGAPGSNGTNAFVCMLSQNTALLQAGERYAYPTTITLAVIGLVGNNRIHTNVGTITGQIPGCLSATVLNNGTTETSIQIDVTSLLEIDGVINIPITVNMSEVYGYSSEWAAADDMWDPTTWTLSTNNFTFSWGLSKKGAPGTPGTSGRGIVSVTEYYALSNSGTVAPADADFGTTFTPPTDATPYVWNYELITYTDDTTTKTQKALICGKGSDGRGITGITEYYAINNDATNPPADSAFTTTMQVPTASNPYLWNYEVCTYSDNSTSRTDKVIIGVKGNDGGSGRGIRSVTEYYACNNNQLSPPADSEFKTTYVFPTHEKRFIWNYELITYTDDTTSRTEKAIIGTVGANGVDGDDGRGITSITEYYAISDSRSVAPDDSFFTTTVQIPTEAERYLWNYEVVAYTDNTTSRTEKAVIGVHGQQGSAGKGIKRIDEYYAISESDTWISTTAQWFLNTVPSVTSSKPYLWNYARTTYTDDTYIETEKHYIGGGKDGVGISYITEYYAISASATTPPGDAEWVMSPIPVVTLEKPYLWNYEEVTYSDGTVVKNTARIIGVRGADGSGRGLVSVTEYYAISNSNTTAPADSEFGTSFVSPTDAQPYLWNYELLTFTDQSTQKTTKAIIGIKGQKGADGKEIVSITEYYCIWNSNTVTPADRYFSTTFTPPTDENPYLWNYEVVTFNDQSTSRTTPVVIGYKAKDGTPGAPGAPGAPGEPGLTGATLRGPVKWEDQTSQRWFLNGVYNSNIPDSEKWIDLMIKDGQVYRCITPYYGTCSSPAWSTASSYWEASDKYKFISTELILADNGKIDILGTNSLRLVAGSGIGQTIVGGAQGGTGTIFYAGTSQANPTPSQAPFHVDYDGKMTAKAGTFAGYVQYPYTFISELNHSGSSYSGYYIADERANLIADAYSGSYGMGDGGCLQLPEPNVNLNGFTYRIMAVANIATKAGLNTSITLHTADSRASHDSPFKIYAFQGQCETSYSMVRFYGGSIELTCMPYHVYDDSIGYFWVVTQATGGVDCYGINQFEWTGAGGGGYWHFYGGDQITASISNPPLNYSYWGHRSFKTSTTATTIRVTVTGNTQSSNNKYYLCLDNENISSAVLTFSGTTTKTYSVTLSDNRSHSFNMFYQKTASTSSDYVNILFEVTSGAAVPAYACSISPVHGYSDTYMDNAVYRIVAESTLPSYKDSNVVYIKRN